MDELLDNYLYWIHETYEDNIFTDGYIGISQDIQKRFREHKADSSNVNVKNHIDKHGVDSLNYTVLCKDTEWICLDLENFFRPEPYIGFNVAIGGHKSRGRTGMPHTEETKRKIGDSHRGREVTEETRELLRNRIPNWVLPEESRQILRDRNATAFEDPGYRKAHKDSVTANPNMAKKLDEESVRAIKVALMEGKLSQAKIAKAHNVSQSIVCNINTGKIWDYVNIQETT